MHGYRYGTSKKVITDALARGEDLILEIDWQGAQQVRALYPDCVGIFILPPSIEELERRMRSRGQDAEAVIRRRLDNARGEMEHAGEFDYAIINKDFETAMRELAEIIQKETSLDAMARITVDDCLKRIPNRFQLTLAATYRARQLGAGAARWSSRTATSPR